MRFSVPAVLAVLALAGAPLAAQIPEPVPEEAASSFVICGQPYDATHPWSWQQLQERFAGEIASGDFAGVRRQLARAYALSPNQAPEVRPIVTRHLERVLGGAGARQEMEVTSAFDPTTGGRRVSLFPGEDRIDLADCGPDGERKAGLDELRYLAHALVQLSDLELSAARGAAFDRLQDVEEEFDRYLFKGFPMFPWENAVNGLLAPDDLTSGPPHHQIVLLHPGAGAEVAPESITKNGWRPVLSVEPFGWIYYPPSREHETWFGVSALVTFRDDMGYGVGGLFHYRNYSLGAVWHDDGKGGSLFRGDLQIFLGVDLFQVVKKRQQQLAALKAPPGAAAH